MQMDSQNPDVEAAFREASDARQPEDITQLRNANGGVPQSYLEADPTLNDYYTTTGKYEVLELDRQEGQEVLDGLSEEDRTLLESGKQYYEITFRNVGGLVMPLIVEFEFEDGASASTQRHPCRNGARGGQFRLLVFPASGLRWRPSSAKHGRPHAQPECDCAGHAGGRARIQGHPRNKSTMGRGFGGPCNWRHDGLMKAAYSPPSALFSSALRRARCMGFSPPDP